MNLKRVLILSKITRYEFEELRYKCEDHLELKEKLAERGSNIESLLLHHKTHHINLNLIMKCFSEKEIKAKLVTRHEYETENIHDYDAIFTCGGDGTFLMAANKIHRPDLPVIGINTDPLNSEGYLCLPSKYTNDFKNVLDRIHDGEFKWLRRNRISVVLSGKDISPKEPVKIHDQQLAFPEFRFYEHVKEYENHMRGFHGDTPSNKSSNDQSTTSPIQYKCDLDHNGTTYNNVASSIISPNDINHNILTLSSSPTSGNGNNDNIIKESTSTYRNECLTTKNISDTNRASLHHDDSINNNNINGYIDHINVSSTSKYKEFVMSPPSTNIKRYKLPDLALNEIFIGESLSSRVSYYELSIDDELSTKQRSSGLTVCTGTGSSSWYFNINKIPSHSVSELIKITNELTGTFNDYNNMRLMREISDKFNTKLIFPPHESHMAYTIRDPVINNVCGIDRPRGFAKRIKVKSRCWDACIVLDGGYSYSFNDGAIAELSVDPKNALLTITL